MEEAQRRLGIKPFKITAEPPRACFEVSTSARRQMDGERVVWEIALSLDVSGDPIEWTIIWEESEY
ncbi:hypothetical protein AX760_13630 [Pararhizobium antarcticum]|uniref:Uncharacterized protein n=1 Tax=Pararhizobium antarcticum TaxID=1798805 RepID=A0A657LX16_9HYPH|nr:hypothetical protein AX760_13630 [Pararhizobium antarcticum]